MSGLGPAASAIEMTDDIRTALEQASSPEEMKDILHEQAVAQGLATRDTMDSTVLIPTERATTQTTVSKDITVNGVTYNLTGDSDADLASLEADFYRNLGNPPSTQQVEPHGRGTDGRFVAAEDAAAQVDFQAWKAATDAFKARHPEWEELAGEENTRIMGTILSENNLLDEADKLGAMERAYAHGKQNEMFSETPQGRTVRLIGEAQTPEELRAALGRNPYAN